jgi:hypothetical protein
LRPVVIMGHPECGHTPCRQPRQGWCAPQLKQQESSSTTHPCP